MYGFVKISLTLVTLVCLLPPGNGFSIPRPVAQHVDRNKGHIPTAPTWNNLIAAIKSYLKGLKEPSPAPAVPNPRTWPAFIDLSEEAEAQKPSLVPVDDYSSLLAQLDPAQRGIWETIKDDAHKAAKKEAKEVAKKAVAKAAKRVTKKSEKVDKKSPLIKGLDPSERDIWNGIRKEADRVAKKAADIAAKKAVRKTTQRLKRKDGKKSPPPVESYDKSEQGSTPQEPSEQGFRPQEPSEQGFRPQEPSEQGFRPQEPSEQGFPPQEPLAEQNTGADKQAVGRSIIPDFKNPLQSSSPVGEMQKQIDALKEICEKQPDGCDRPKIEYLESTVKRLNDFGSMFQNVPSIGGLGAPSLPSLPSVPNVPVGSSTSPLLTAPTAP